MLIGANFALDTWYKLTIGTVKNGKVTADKTQYRTGDEVMLTLKPDYGYSDTAGELTLSEQNAEEEQWSRTYTNLMEKISMPVCDARLDVTFALKADYHAITLPPLRQTTR